MVLFWLNVGYGGELPANRMTDGGRGVSKVLEFVIMYFFKLFGVLKLQSIRVGQIKVG